MKIQQGDCLFREIKNIPKDAKRVIPENGKYVLRRGEATGHAHTIEATEEIECYEKDGILYLKSIIPIEVNHQEHKTQTLEPDMFWMMTPKVEYDPEAENIKQIRD